MEFYVKLKKKTESFDEFYYTSFCVGATPILRNEIRKLINKEVCKTFDNKLNTCNVKYIKDNINLINHTNNFTYNFLNDLINNIRYDFVKDDKTDYVRFYTDYTDIITKYDVNREFCDIFQRLIEYGNDTLFPMQIFGKAFTKFNKIITAKYHDIFK